jgi:hypothetical protein
MFCGIYISQFEFLSMRKVSKRYQKNKKDAKIDCLQGF